MSIQAVVTSKSSRKLTESLGIALYPPEETDHIDLAIDRVDDIGSDFCSVKGGGLVREKIAACKEDQVIWIMDESRLVKRLGSFPLPVVVLPLGCTWEARQIVKIRGCRGKRKEKYLI